MTTKPKGPFCRAGKRLRELGRIIDSRNGKPGFADPHAYLRPVANALQCRLITDGRLVARYRSIEALFGWVHRYRLPVGDTAVTESYEEATRENPYLEDDRFVAKLIRLTYEERQRLKVTTIGACDADKKELARLAKERKRANDRKRRAAQRRKAAERKGRAVLPRDQWLATSASRTQPWIAEDISPRTWWRQEAKRRGTSGSPTRGTSGSPTRGTSGSVDPSYKSQRPTNAKGPPVQALAHAGGTGNPPAKRRQSEPPAFCCRGKTGVDAEPIPQPSCSAEGWLASAPVGSAVARPAVEARSTLSPNREGRPSAARGARAKRLRAEQDGQLNWIEPSLAPSLGQPDRAARADDVRDEASVPRRAAVASKLSPEVFRRMAKLQRWGIPADRVTAWHRHVSDAVLEELFATAVRRNRGPSDAREWLEEQMQCAMSDPHYESPTRPERRRRPAKLVLATYDKSGARVLTRGGIAKLLEEMGEAMRKDQLGPLLGIMASDGSLILMSRGRYRRPDAEQQSEAPSSSKREMAS
jgi:hypothetical protein